MAVRLGAHLPRLALVALFLLGGTASLALATQQQLTASHAAAKPAAAPAVEQTLTIPDIRGQAFVFAKGILEDNGFAWRVNGSVKGFATNIVATQLPAAGAKVADTGAPLVTLTLVRNRKYAQHGTPENTSPYDGTSVLVTSSSAARARLSTEAAAPAAIAKPAHKTAPKAAPTTKKNSPSTKAPAATKAAYPQHRPAAFTVARAPNEPLDEMPLPDRAQLLSSWLGAHPKPTNANVRHWLYQHAWVVTGARFGWWRGAEALRILIGVDRHVEATWGIGRRSELTARAALAFVEATSK
jgi:PASTA domain